MSKTTIYLKDYQPAAFAIYTVNLQIDLYDDHAMVQSTLTLARQSDGPLRLYGDELTLMRVTMDGRELPSSEYALEGSDLVILHPKDEMTLEITTKIYPQNNTKLMGLYRSNHLFCTQCEAEGFRRITYFLDRPDVLSVYSTRISADKAKYPVLLSNGNLVDSGDESSGRHWVLWQDPYRKPSYLFALVAGNLACIQDNYLTMSGRNIDLRIYVEPGNEDKCTHAMTSLKKSMHWDEEVYGREYDLDIFMIVAVSDFNMGAMENKGLNIFNSKYILAKNDTATDTDYADIEGVVAHEYFHNWTGNRVTCRDWFQLSLKEGLTVFRDQEFSRDMNSRDVCRIMDVKALRSTQFPEDAGSMAHPVRPDSYQEINNFYTATVYNKGAEVIRMQHTLLGADGFRKGMDLYFDRHDGHAVTIDDFVAAMEDANNVNLSQFKRWYNQSGTPLVQVKSEFNNGQLRLILKQSCPPTPQQKEKLPFHMPISIALFTKDGQQMSLGSSILELKDKEQTFIFGGLQEKPVVSLLRGFSAPITLDFPMSEEERLFLLRHETDGYAKWDATQQLVISNLRQAIQSSSDNLSVSKALLSALEHVLHDSDLDNSLAAELLAPPGFEEVVANLKDIDVTMVERVRDDFRKTLGSTLYAELHTTYERLWRQEDNSMDGQAYGRRQLRNICLWLMMKSNERDALDACVKQFEGAKNMTDQVCAFGLLANCKAEDKRVKTIEQFYTQWSSDELVMDKWFAILATAEHADTLQNVKKLMKHPAFNLKNPNKVRALVGAFSQANPRNFHAVDGLGYEFLQETLLTLDKINPQIAARLATPFTRFARYDSPRRALMTKQLEIMSREQLSPDLQEVVSKSLV